VPPPGAAESWALANLSNHSRGTAVDIDAQHYERGTHRPSLDRFIELARAVSVPVEHAGQTLTLGLVCGADWRGADRDDIHFELGRRI
jgi:D-alanyl-D-alanine dipeptidase